MQNPILKASGVGWNKDGMHHIDLHQVEQDKWIACVDGFYIVIDFEFNLDRLRGLFQKLN